MVGMIVARRTTDTSSSSTGGEMKFIIEVRYGAASADTLYTLLEQQFREVIHGGDAEGFTVEGSWVAIETGTAFVALEAKDGLRVYDLCYQVAQAAEGVHIRALPVIPMKRIEKLPG
jgi:hypothetical protein